MLQHEGKQTQNKGQPCTKNKKETNFQNKKSQFYKEIC